jgi:methyltransferase (TIGR00027 family)
MGRALANARGGIARFSDPTALALLPEDSRKRVLRAINGSPPRTMRERIGRRVLERLASMMIARTIEIDDAVRSASHPQIVILGSGLDGRAWRMPELKETVVFEVDHPSTQRDKQSRSASLEPTAREVRFVAVDFARDDLDAALSAAGHDPSLPTTWIWEGVIMYLTLQDIEATLAVIERRSAPESRLLVLYHAPTPLLFLVGYLVRRMGEPLRSRFKVDEMRTLLLRYGFGVQRDLGLDEIGAAPSWEMGRATRPMRHLRLATASRL